MSLLAFEEARARVLAGVTRVGEERVAFADAVGRVLADDLTARRPMPAFDYSAMDGYAVRVGDLAGDGPWTLPVASESRTGAALPPPLDPGAACRIFTGARPPDGADAVVMQEDTTREGDRVTLRARPKPGAHLRRAGEDVRAGAVVLPAGTRVTPWALMLLATAERARVTVAARPRVAVVSTGDELRDLGDDPAGGTVLDANGPTLAALVARVGGAPSLSRRAPDDLPGTRAVLQNALQRNDLVLTIGGVSVGDHDVVRAALEAEGVALDFWKVAIKPGKPVVLGARTRDGQTVRVLGLPGNPSSAALTFALFAAPLIRAMQGDARPVPAEVDARLSRAVKRAAGRTEFLRVRLTRDARGLVAEPLDNQASGAVTSFAWADAVARVPAEVAQLDAGATVACTLLSEV
ncbi:MAG: gephyrin-like molybdotransferase Glp [Polyangiales bacterium]